MACLVCDSSLFKGSPGGVEPRREVTYLLKDLKWPPATALDFNPVSDDELQYYPWRERMGIEPTGDFLQDALWF